MAKCSIAELTGRGVIRIAGEDAKKFLQDVVTNDVNRAVDDGAVHAALLTPQGKILFDFFLLAQGDHFLLECAKDGAAELIKRLTFYRLRANVLLEDVTASHTVWAAWDGAPEAGDGAIMYPDPRLAALGVRIITPAASAPASGCNSASEAEYDRHRITLGVPESVKDYPLGGTFPHDADYDQLAGVDFNKGCYVGQEVVGRMQHRGNARKRVVPVKGSGPLTAGSEISAGETSIGVLGSVSAEIGLGMVRLDRAEKAISEGRALMAGDVEIALIQPGWARFTVPTQGSAR